MLFAFVIFTHVGFCSFLFWCVCGLNALSVDICRLSGILPTESSVSSVEWRAVTSAEGQNPPPQAASRGKSVMTLSFHVLGVIYPEFIQQFLCIKH